MSKELVAAIILAAGSSSRMGGVKKEFQKLENGLTVLGNSVRVFASSPLIQNIVIVIPENSEAEAKAALPQEYIKNQNLRIIFVTGGNTRRASVLNALTALTVFSPRYVLIHDGARPWLSLSLVERLITDVKKYDAVIPVLQLTDTPKELKIKNKEWKITRHLNRASIGAAQTPQAFKFPEILNAHSKAAQVDEEFTDDAEIWGRFCGLVSAIPGEPENRKITFKEDLDKN
ncbi:MAG: 2-C-methyl-D-erythritol 4-phosphate cytidylyltransferase [Treponema sp.]|nr:2-C-methyl-D-erythritol 4-phosphate cytidylyltransferase [Treponema sp.]